MNYKAYIPIFLSFFIGIIILLIFKLYPQFDPHFSSDGVYYLNEGTRLLKENVNSYSIGWVYINSVFVWLFGDMANHLVRVFNLVLYFLLVLFIIRGISINTGKVVECYYVFIISFIPSIFYFSIMNLKELAIIFIIILTIHIASSSASLFSKLVLLTPLLYIGSLVRIYLVVLIIVMLYIYFLFRIYDKIKEKDNFFIFFILYPVVFFLFSNSYLQPLFDYLYGSFQEIQLHSSSGLGEYITAPSSTVELLITIPYRAIIYIITPMPWETTSLLYLVGVLENYILFVPLLIYTLINFRIVKNNNFLLMLLSFVFTNILFYSSVMSNSGIVVRMQSSALFCLVVMFIYIRIIKKVEK